MDVNTARFTGLLWGGQSQQGPSVLWPRIWRPALNRPADSPAEPRRHFAHRLYRYGQRPEREQVRLTLERALSHDRIKTVIHGFTKLGLLEMTRKRTRESLSQVWAAQGKDKGSVAPRGKGKDNQA